MAACCSTPEPFGPITSSRGAGSGGGVPNGARVGALSRAWAATETNQ